MPAAFVGEARKELNSVPDPWKSGIFRPLLNKLPDPIPTGMPRALFMQRLPYGLNNLH
jgi:hypothetical protein